MNQVTPRLFSCFPDAAARCGFARVRKPVRSTGFYNKAKNIQAACGLIQTEFGGQVPQRMEQLLQLPGVARKTANVVLAHAYGFMLG